jgi:uncharacterized protein DUF6651
MTRAGSPGPRRQNPPHVPAGEDAPRRARPGWASTPEADAEGNPETTHMPLKYDAQGNIVTADLQGKKVPVFVNEKGEEAPFDCDGTVATIARLNGEARDHRVGKEKAEGALKVYTDLGVTDAAAAKKAMETVANLDTKKLVDAGEIERVKAEIRSAFEGQLGAEKKTNEALNGRLNSLLIGTAFAGSKFISEKGAVPADIFQARFGQHFSVEGDSVVAKDAAGNKIYSLTSPGNLAGFDEAIKILVEGYAHKDSLLKGTGSSGGGSQNQGAGGKGKDQPAGNLVGSRDERRGAVAQMFPDLPSANAA